MLLLSWQITNCGHFYWFSCGKMFHILWPFEFYFFIFTCAYDNILFSCSLISLPLLVLTLQVFVRVDNEFYKKSAAFLLFWQGKFILIWDKRWCLLPFPKKRNHFSAKTEAIWVPQHEVSQHNGATNHVTARDDRHTGFDRWLPLYDGIFSPVVCLQQKVPQEVSGEEWR